MSEREGQGGERRAEAQRFRFLAVVASLSTCVYGIIAVLSWRFDFESVVTQRPIVPVLLLFAAVFAGYLFAIRTALQMSQSRQLLRLIIWFAVVFRVVMLFSVPIQEIDIYRYLWDGATSVANVSPFRYSPAQVLAAEASSTNDKQLLRVIQLRDKQPALAEILSRIHFGELPTVYPPTSQAVFAAAAITTPADASVAVRVFVMKIWFVGFELATLLVVIGLLKLSQKPVGLCVIYAWCPLLLKETANSGHLDAVAVFLTTLAVYLAAKVVSNTRNKQRASASSLGLATLAASVLALAVGAKLYPIVLAPLFLLILGKQLGWRRVLIPTAVFTTTTFVVLWPMLPHAATIPETSQNVSLGASEVPPPPLFEQATPTDPSLGLQTFLKRWEMNDFIFLVLVENLKPASDIMAGQAAWFSLAPDTWRQSVAVKVASFFRIAPQEAPFLTSRAMTAACFLAVALALAWRAAKTTNVDQLCEAGFLTLAWFWLLCPTQNPWYWTWALPLLPFARGRVWLAVSGLVLLYYLRFWFSYHWAETPVGGSGYAGAVFFDFIVTWFEFAPWFVALVVGVVLRRHNAAPMTSRAREPQMKYRSSTDRE